MLRGRIVIGYLLFTIFKVSPTFKWLSAHSHFVRNEVCTKRISTEHMFRTTFTFRIARYLFRTKAIHTSFDTKFVSAQFALKFVNAQCVYVNLAGCADWQTGNSDPALLILLTFNITSRIKTNTNSNTEKARLKGKSSPELP